MSSDNVDTFLLEKTKRLGTNFKEGMRVGVLRLGTSYPGTLIHQYYSNKGKNGILTRSRAYDIMPDKSLYEIHREEIIPRWTSLIGESLLPSRPMSFYGSF